MCGELPTVVPTMGWRWPPSGRRWVFSRPGKKLEGRDMRPAEVTGAASLLGACSMRLRGARLTWPSPPPPPCARGRWFLSLPLAPPLLDDLRLPAPVPGLGTGPLPLPLPPLLPPLPPPLVRRRAGCLRTGPDRSMSSTAEDCSLRVAAGSSPDSEVRTVPKGLLVDASTDSAA